MRTNLFKSLLVAVMAIGAMGGVKAEEITSVIYSQDFDSETSIPEGWTHYAGTFELATDGNNKYLVEKTDNNASGNRHAWYNGNIFSNLIANKTNWIVEFDCLIAEGTKTDRHSQGVWLLGKDLTYKYNTPNKPIIGICKNTGSNGKYILNVNATNTEHTIDLKSNTYYHYKVTYDKGTKKLKFAIFSQDEKTVVFEETSFDYDYTTSSMGDFASIAFQAGRGYSKTAGFTCLDNIKVSTVSSEEIVANPTAKITSVNGTDRTVTLSSDNSSYKLFYYLDDNSSEPTEYKAPFVVSKSSTVSYYAQSTSGTKSQIQTLDVVCENVVLNNPTFEKKSYNDGVSSVALYSDQSDKECTPVAKIHYELSNGTSGTVNNADVINVADGLILSIYSEAEGYTNSSTVSVYAQSMSGKVEFSETYNGRVSSDATLTIGTEPVATISKTDFYSIYNGEQLISDKLLAASKNDKYFMLRPNGLYSGAGRTFAIQNLKAGQYIILKGVYSNGNFSVSSFSNMTQNSWNTINGNTYAFIVDKDGDVTFNIPRYGCFQSISIISPTETVSVTEAGYATYATKHNVIVPSDVEVMTVKVNDDNTSISLYKVAAGTVIPAKTGILVKAAAGNHDFVVTSDKSEESEALTKNDLKAATAEKTSNGSTFFALTKIGDKVGFAVVNKGVKIPAGKAYLEVPEGNTPAAKFFGLDGEATGINSVKTAKADGAYYTLEGVKTTKPVKGLYIHNGKKIVVK